MAKKIVYMRGRVKFKGFEKKGGKWIEKLSFVTENICGQICDQKSDSNDKIS